jgi:hypothetical protein
MYADNSVSSRAVGTSCLAGLIGAVLLLVTIPVQASVYWNLFNIEGEDSQNSVFITYNALADMLTDSNRVGSFIPDTAGGAAENVVGSGASPPPPPPTTGRPEQRHTARG